MVINNTMVNRPEDELIKLPAVELDPKTKRAQSIVGTSAGRPDGDFYPTPPEATLALLAEEKFTGTIWEPACGNGAMSKVLEDAGHVVMSSDLYDRGFGETSVDFLKTTRSVENVVTNPPFKLAQEFVEHSLNCTTGKVAMLCKLVFLEGQKRRSFFESTPLARVHVFSKRVNFYREGEKGKLGTSMMAFAWFVWEHGHEGPPTINWI